MRRLFLLIVGHAVFLLAFARLGLAIEENHMFPKVDIENNATESFSSEKFLGKVTVVNFWAAWCEACKIELVEMESAFSTLFKDKDFQFLFVSLDKNPAEAVTWVKQNIKNPDMFLSYLYQDPEFKVAGAWDVDSFPMTFVINKDGKIAKIQRGFKQGDASTEKIAALATEFLKQ